MATDYIIRRVLPVVSVLLSFLLICLIVYVKYSGETQAEQQYSHKSKNFNLIRPCWHNFSHEDYERLGNLENFILDVDKQVVVLPKDSSYYRNVVCENKRLTQLSIPIVEKENNNGNSTDVFIFSNNGNFHFEKYILSKEEYCVESLTKGVITIVACDFTSYCTNGTEQSGKKACLFRCCNYGEVWDVSRSPIRCKDSGIHKWNPIVYGNLYSNETQRLADSTLNRESPILASAHPKVLRPHCKGNYTFQVPYLKLHYPGRTDYAGKFGDKQFKVLPDGTVWINLRRGQWGPLQPGEYCIDGFQLGENTYSGNDHLDVVLFECKEWTTPEEIRDLEKERAYNLSLGIILCCSLLFLAATIIVYILLWSNHNIHGWTVFSYITSMFTTYCLMGVSNFSSALLLRRESPGVTKLYTFCGILGALCHFSFLCTFSWSTVLSFDLFCTFRTLRPRRNEKHGGGKRFLLYCIFAFAVPSLIVSTGIYMDIKHSMDFLHDDVITPEYGKTVCYVQPRYGRVYYVIIPIAVLLGANFLLFCKTAYTVFKVKQSAQFASISSTRKESNNQTFRLIFKLFLINGSVWTVEIISWSLQEDYNKIGILSFLLDVINVLQAVAIFLLFVFKNDILEALRRRYPALNGMVDFAFKLKKLRVPTISRAPGGTRNTGTNASFAMKPLTSKVSIDTCRTIKTQLTSTSSTDSSFVPNIRAKKQCSIDPSLVSLAESS